MDGSVKVAIKPTGAPRRKAMSKRWMVEMGEAGEVVGFCMRKLLAGPESRQSRCSATEGNILCYPSGIVFGSHFEIHLAFSQRPFGHQRSRPFFTREKENSAI